jgi:hypothetical protein
MLGGIFQRILGLSYIHCIVTVQNSIIIPLIKYESFNLYLNFMNYYVNLQNTGRIPRISVKSFKNNLFCLYCVEILKGFFVKFI